MANKQKAKRTVLEVYPDCEKPEWLRVGVKCKCWGEGEDILTVSSIGKNACRMKKGDKDHGWESIKKLHSPLSDRLLTRNENYDKAYEAANKICKWLGMKNKTVTFYELPRGHVTNDEAYGEIGEIILNIYSQFEKGT
jgi:hypothetical protein